MVGAAIGRQNAGKESANHGTEATLFCRVSERGVQAGDRAGIYPAVGGRQAGRLPGHDPKLDEETRPDPPSDGGRAGRRRQRRSAGAQGTHQGAGKTSGTLGDGKGDFKKSDGLLRQPEPVRFGWIHQQREQFEVSIMCQVLQVSRSGYYAWVARAPSSRRLRQEDLIGQIRRAHEFSDGTYGSPRIHAELAEQEIEVCVNTVAKLMKKAG